MATYDAELSTDMCDAYNNAELTLTLRLGFRQINPAGGAAEGTHNDYGKATGTARKTVKWTPGAWSRWKSDFVASAQTFWNGKFWLVNNFDVYTCVVKGVTYRPNVWCRLKIIGSDAPLGSPHHTIDVVRLHASETWFGSHARLYDNLDTRSVQKATDSAGNPVMQRAHVHEIGHVLGLGHVDIGKAHCMPDTNTNLGPCYGVADEDMNSVMGSGMQLRPSHGDPWRKALIALSGKGTLATATDWQTKLARHYPRNPAEVAANAAITARPPGR